MVLRLRFALNTMWNLAPIEAPNVKRGVLVTLTGRRGPALFSAASLAVAAVFSV